MIHKPLKDFQLRKISYEINILNKKTCIKTNNLVCLKKTELMKNKFLLKKCKCIHCQQKLEQINNSRIYWDKLIFSKNVI